MVYTSRVADLTFLVIVGGSLLLVASIFCGVWCYSHAGRLKAKFHRIKSKGERDKAKMACPVRTSSYDDTARRGPRILLLSSWNKLLAWNLFLLTLAVVPTPTASEESTTTKTTVAIIGGGVAGTFTSKYLVDYNAEKCLLESITIFDPNPIGQETKASTTPNTMDWQGSRVAAMKLPDGRVVELGASVFHEANQLLKDMIGNADPELELGGPFHTGKEGPDHPTRQGLGIYHGDGEWLYMSNKTAPFNTFWTLVRYNMDLYRVDRWTTRAIRRFSEIVPLLESNHTSTFFESPDAMWERVELINAVHLSFEQLLDAIGVSKADGYWMNHVFPYQGSIRKELLTAINLINYNQGNSQINGLVGMASFAASKGPLYSVIGGNHQIIDTAFQQAQANSQKSCENNNIVLHKQQTVTTVVGSMNGFEIFSGRELIGTYDTVILAAPLQQARIEFLIPSQWDGAVLQQMPLAGGMVKNPDESSIEAGHEGHPILPGKLPPCASKPFTQVVTTVVSQGTLNHEYFHVLKEKLPRAVCMTEKGKHQEHNITVISELAGDGVYKVFSSDLLDKETLSRLFGPQHTVEFTKVSPLYHFTFLYYQEYLQCKIN